jgi:hypothetical protein
MRIPACPGLGKGERCPKGTTKTEFRRIMWGRQKLISPPRWPVADSLVPPISHELHAMAPSPSSRTVKGTPAVVAIDVRRDTRRKR